MGEPTDRVILDIQGRPLFRCAACGEPLRESDFSDLGLRVPEQGETAEEYQDAELVDDLRHLRCLRAAARQAG